MNTTKMINQFLEHCTFFRHLSTETIRAYSGDLHQFESFSANNHSSVYSSDTVKTWLKHLTSKYKPSTIHRKISSVKAFFKYAQSNGWINSDPFSFITLKIKRTESLPKDIDLHDIERILRYAYKKYHDVLSPTKHMQAMRNVAIIELLFSTGIRVSELCSLTPDRIDFETGRILIHGKGNKERIVYIGSQDVITLLNHYVKENHESIVSTGYVFTSQQRKIISTETVRSILSTYSKKAGVSSHITPHGFRHTFATSLVNADVNLRHIQTLLGHSSIRVTEIYTHVASVHHKEILREKHPRSRMNIC